MPGWDEKVLDNPRAEKYVKKNKNDKDAITAKNSADEIDAFARKLASKAENMGYKIAATHLQRYLDGIGGTEHPKRRWLRSYKKVRDAENPW
jgi:hypothetical protein